jgi:hypothetical protein
VLNLRHRLTCVLIASCIMGCEFVHDNIWSLWNFRADIDIDFAERCKDSHCCKVVV